MGFLKQEELDLLGFKFLGKNVKISENAIIYNYKNISIDDNTRIDDFCLLSAGEGGIEIGKFVHIAAYCSMQGAGKVVMEDFSGLSSRVSVYSSSDDYSGQSMTNPCIDKQFTNIDSGDVIIKRHVIVGVNSCILPNVTIGSGSAIGAFSLVNKDVPNSVIAVGVPAKEKVKRSENLFEIEKLFLSSLTETEAHR